MKFYTVKEERNGDQWTEYLGFSYADADATRQHLTYNLTKEPKTIQKSTIIILDTWNSIEDWLEEEFWDDIEEGIKYFKEFQNQFDGGPV